ncbi:MAG: DNA polymerase III subunit gamma/tau [Candidatus Omnitrophica bacterium]|nr:DNA polymerase III subunit gamma/tau [Candidatus Omnitrophota bacterium]
MSYTVFALKWRPQDFDEIIGQVDVVTRLKGAIKNNRVASAYLFAGTRGTGKTSTARIFAKALNCKDGPTIKPCGKCASCVEIAKGNSLDVIEIDGASNRGIDEIRALRESVKFAPVQGKYKIYIIDEVHQITTDGFNALLKTLEEPPEFVRFIFATTHPHKVIPTILSRCQRFDFRRISVMEIIGQLERISKAEGLDIDKDVIFAIARASDGSLRDAESVLDQLASFSKDKISLKDVISVLGLVEQESLFALTDAIIKKDSLSALKLLDSIIDSGKDIAVLLSSLIEHFRNLMVAKISRADSKLIDLPQDICETLLKQADSFTLEEIFSAFTTMINAQEMSRRMESVRIPLEISLVKLTQDKKSVGRHDPVDDVRPAKSVHRHPDDPLPAPQSDPPAPSGPSVPLDEVKRLWHDIVEAVSKVKMHIGTYLSEGVPVKSENNILLVAFPKDCSLHKESLEEKDNRAIIEKIAGQVCNASLKVNFILSKDVSSKSDNPVIKSALETFSGRVVREE